MQVLPTTKIEDIKILTAQSFFDHRGYFLEMFKESTFRRLGINFEVKQINTSLSRAKGTLRGLHFQSEPFAQSKIVTCQNGIIFDVAVDLRPSSPTFRKYVSFLMISDSLDQTEKEILKEIEADHFLEPFNFILIPKGFAHGFLTLTQNTTVIYFLDNEYLKTHDRSLLWCDESIAIKWPPIVNEFILSEKDRSAPKLIDLLNNNIL